jgi:hypothetical protein
MYSEDSFLQFFKSEQFRTNMNFIGHPNLLQYSVFKTSPILLTMTIYRDYNGQNVWVDVTELDYGKPA